MTQFAVAPASAAYTAQAIENNPVERASASQHTQPAKAIVELNQRIETIANEVLGNPALQFLFRGESVQPNREKLQTRVQQALQSYSREKGALQLLSDIRGDLPGNFLPLRT